MSLTEIKESRIWATAAFVLVLIVLVMTFAMRQVWWTFFDIFFAFMAAFSHLMSVMLVGINRTVSRKLDFCALVFVALAVAAFIAQFIAYQLLF